MALAWEKIKLIKMRVKDFSNLQEPEIDDIEKDDYRAYTRHTPMGN